ncbi:CDP-alcohol phosphatidyltransferase family protein [Alicyclobacillus mengziensis]|uniref:CDP-alcohol phosphatidyltransferase family protein n=1 Tax=Alicyclobacillus mengziensis TaxID=2931921 RepID=UPI0020121D55|nr:CDP-alcohol phosphatidyltransferase family protein [Alicyclobacillus mengziensis]
MASQTGKPLSDFENINRCAKRPTDIWTNYLYYTFSLRLVYMIRKTRITPNMLTLTALILVLIGSALYAVGLRTDITLGLILIQVSYVFDCADGQLARYKKLYSPIGGWLDQMADRVKEFAVIFGLAYGYSRFHAGIGIWKWAMISLFALYLLEYLGQIEMIRGMRVAPEHGSADMARAGSSLDVPDTGDAFSKVKHIRALIPFRSFIIGEQYFAMLVFIAFDAVYPYMVFVSIIGLLMAIYRPVMDYVKFHRRITA